MAATLAVVLAALNYGKLPFINSNRHYSAYFAEAGGLLTGAAVQVSGFKSGKVTGIDLDGPRVLVTFEVDEGIRLGDRTEAAIKTKSILGAKILELTPPRRGLPIRPIPPWTGRHRRTSCPTPSVTSPPPSANWIPPSCPTPGRCWPASSPICQRLSSPR